MSKRDQLADARREGMAFCIRYLENHTNDELIAEVKRRGAYNVPLGLSQEDAEAWGKDIRKTVLSCILVLVELTLHDEFDFEEKELLKFKDRFEEKSECVSEDYTSWPETLEILKDECNIEFSMDWDKNKQIGKNKGEKDGRKNSNTEDKSNNS